MSFHLPDLKRIRYPTSTETISMPNVYTIIFVFVGLVKNYCSIISLLNPSSDLVQVNSATHLRRRLALASFCPSVLIWSRSMAISHAIATSSTI